MDILWADGFRYPRSYDFYNLETSTGGGRNNGTDTYGVLCKYGSPAAGKILAAGVATITVGFALKFNYITAGNPNTIRTILTLWSGSTIHLDFRVNSADNTISVYRGTGGTNLLGTSAAVFSTFGDYAYIEITAKIDDTAGVVNIWNYGTSVLALSGVDTRNGANANTDQVYLGSFGGIGPGSGGIEVLFDDYYIGDPGGVVTAHLSTSGGSGTNVRVIDALPVAAGDITQFTPNTGANWSAASSYDGDTSYVASSTVGQRDLYNFTDMPSGLSNIVAMHVQYQVRKDDAPARGLKIGVKSGGTIYDQSEVALTNSYVTEQFVLPTDPATGAAWTESGLNAVQMGPLVSS